MERRRRFGLIAVGFPLLIAAELLVVSALGADDSDTAAVAALLGVSWFGVIANRWWAIGLPVVWGALYLATLRVLDLATGACHACGSDEDWSNFPLLFQFWFVLPLTLAVLVGVVLGMVVRRARRKAGATAVR